MAKRRNIERIEPSWGTARGGMDLRARAEDRPTHLIKTKPPRGERPHPDDAIEPAPPRKPARNAAKLEAPVEEAPRRKKRKRRGLVGMLLVWSMTAAVWAVILIAGVVAWYAAHLPPTHQLEVPPRPPNIMIVAENGAEIANRGDMGGAAVQLRALPRHLPQALIAIEDRRFYSHFGVDVIGLARAVYTNVLNRRASQGGSTLTQQLAKNLFLAPDRTLGRKVQEAILALWLERNYSKDQILELYLNRVYFGAGAYGVEAAARRYYNKPASALTLQEAATLAGLVQAPSRLAPTRNPEGAEARAQLVLAAMVDQGYITEDQAKAAFADPATASRGVPGGSINYVADWIMDLLDDYVGQVDGDLVVETTIDQGVQQAAERALAEELSRAGQRFDVRQGAVVVLDTEGAIKALVGGRDYNASQFNRAVSARRQPGSAFKPFVFLAGLERGLAPDTRRSDSAVAIGAWRPENYTRDYRGDVTLTTALSASLNTVAVRLGQEVGPRQIARTAQRLGVNSRLEANPSLALGTSEVTLVELAGAYAPFANGGTQVASHVITRVRTAAGRVLFQRARPPANRVVSPEHVGMMNAMMHETTVSGTARAARLLGWAIAGKTGTSQEFRDAWFIGYSGRFVAGVWLGNDDGAPTRRHTGGALPAEIWTRVMARAHEGQRPIDLPGDWRRYVGPQRGPATPREAIDQPMVMSRAEPSRPVQGALRPPSRTAEQDPSDVVRPPLGDGFLGRLFGR